MPEMRSMTARGFEGRSGPAPPGQRPNSSMLHGPVSVGPGGRIGEGEDAEDAAYRECFEEVGVWAVRMQEFTRSEKDGVEYTTFLMLGSEFQPLMNIEHKTSKWVSLDKALTMKLHPRARETIELLAKAIKEQEES